MSSNPGTVLHEIGELLELGPSGTANQVNALLALGWILLRVADSRSTYLLGWLRSHGEPQLPSWYVDQQRERATLMEALETSSLATEAVLDLE